MGLVFNSTIAGHYYDWTASGQGRAIEKSLEGLVTQLLDPKSGDRVLDIGCGAANHLLIFSRMGLDVSGVDSSKAMINRAQTRLGNRCTLKTAPAQDLPFDDNEFDLATLINTLEFLDDPIEALREAGRVAQKRVFVGVFNSLSWNGVIKKAQGYLGNPLFRRARFYNLWQLKSLLEAAYGPVPMQWKCVKIQPRFYAETDFLNKGFWNWENSPFGFFLGISATLVYRFKTKSLPLKVRVKNAGQPLIGSRTIEDVNRNQGVPTDARSFFI
jgi:ubiquinone/menaquinone biosynthesis C-methylase UbiE